MINELLIMLKEYSILLSVLLGLAASLSPCTFATNVAAISYIIANNPKKSIFIGTVFSLGRIVMYSFLGILLVYFGKEIGQSQYFNSILGILLVAIGYMFLDIFTVNVDFSSKISQVGSKYKDYGVIGAFILGILFALAFCPYSGALFFGILIPMSIQASLGLTYPALFGIGVSIPILAVSSIIYFGASAKMSVFTEKWTYLSKIMGTVLIIVGIYYIKIYMGYKIGLLALLLSIGVLSYKILQTKVHREQKIERSEDTKDTQSQEIFRELSYLTTLDEETVSENFEELLGRYIELEERISAIQNPDIKKKAERQLKEVINMLYKYAR